MVLNNRPSKRAKRNRVTADLCDFFTFPAVEDTALSAEPFRESVKVFVSRHAQVTFPPSLFPSLHTWQILFRVGDMLEGPDLSPVVVALDIVEEDVTRSSRSVYCSQCRVVGWSGHPVCQKRYHFIIRANNSSVEGYQRQCSSCSNLLHISDSRCKWCNAATCSDDLEDWVYSQFEDNSHLLHGVVHSNGFGHLLVLNGREGGSNILTGCDIMNFWDRLCTTLSVRMVSVMDVSKKYGIEYRLLHAITKGHSWYGDWGYEFGCGSYALTLDAYQKAVETLSNVALAPFLIQGRRPRTQLQSVIAFYCSLSDSELVTLKDLFSFLLMLTYDGRKPNATLKNLESTTSSVLCAWTRNDVEKLQQAMIKVLHAAAGNNWVTRRALKGVKCKVASPELIDYCLKHLGGKLAGGGMVVQSRCNPISTYDTEFRLVPLNFVHCGDGLNSNLPSKEHIKRDLKFLFDSLLNPETMIKFRPHVTRESMIDSTTKLLDCKQFMKDYRPDKRMVNNPFVIRLLCHVGLSDQPKKDPAVPPELVVLPSNATVADLKNGVTKAFQEVYAMFRRFEVDELPEYGSLEDNLTLKFLVGTYGSVKIKGRCLSKQAISHFRMERGTENWIVDCSCGAKDDDGERMLACDACGVWQHTRCTGMDNSGAIFTKFVCMRCLGSLNEKSERTSKSKEASEKVSTSASCRDEAVGSNIDGVGTKLDFVYV